MSNPRPRSRVLTDMNALPTAATENPRFVGVRATGVFCRSGCPTLPRAAGGADSFGTVREALFAGFRPCGRCEPAGVAGDLPDWAALLLAKVEAEPGRRLSGRDLRGLGIDPARASRFFQKTYGVTFQAYCRARRLSASLQEIRRGGRGSSDGIVASWIESPIGPLVAGATAQGVCLLEFTERRMLEAQFTTLRRKFRCAIVPGSNAHLARLEMELAEYFRGQRHRFTVALDFPGTEFQRRVWEELLRIPYGATTTYKDLARTLGAPRAFRAVGHANGLNRVAIVIPCHRVVGHDGKLGGYGGGLWRKQRLLELESGQGRLDKVEG